MPSIGTTLVDRYVLEDTISEGAMGRVYRARDTSLGTQVALKVILGQWLQYDEVRARFEREAMASAKIRHPNVVSAIDYGTIESTGSAYLVTPLVQGVNLRDFLAGPLPLSQVKEIAQQLCNALRAAHDAGVIHRDLKPENILLETVDEGLFVRLVDFGIASERSSGTNADGPALTQVGTVLGTPGYMAPEQLSGESAQAATDVYAMGVLLYEMLTGTPPFSGGLAELAAQQVNRAVDIDRLKKCAPSSLRKIILESLSPKPENRPSLDKLADVVAASDIHPKTRWHKMGSRVAKHWKALAVAAAIFVVAALVTLGSGVPGELEPVVERMQEAKASGVRRRAAERILSHEDQEEIPEAVRAIAEFEQAKTCGTRKSALQKLRDLPDQEDVQYIFERLDKERSGCGFLGRSDCHRCLRSDLDKILGD